MNQQDPNHEHQWGPLNGGTQKPKKKHTARTVLIILGTVFIGIPAVVGIIGAAAGSEDAKAPVSVTSQAGAKPKATARTSKTPEPTYEQCSDGALRIACVEPTKAPATTEAPTLTKSQEQAIGSAEQYLSFTAFSRKGLIQQLSSGAGEGFSVADATYAVDHIKVNWNEQAAKSAKSYLSMMHFSRQGLIRQLESSAGEGFTHSQAVYGVTKAGL
jgi:hypothetical protein